MYTLLLQSNHQVRLLTHTPTNVSWKRVVTLPEFNSIVLAAEDVPNPMRELPCDTPSFTLVRQVYRELAEAFQERSAIKAHAAAWRCASQVPQDLLHMLPILMLRHAFLNATIFSRWTWWYLAVKSGWRLSEAEWEQLMLDIAYCCEALLESDTIGATNASATLPETISAFPTIIGTCLFCLWIHVMEGQGTLANMTFMRQAYVQWVSRPVSGKQWEIASSDPCEACIIVSLPELSRSSTPTSFGRARTWSH